LDPGSRATNELAARLAGYGLPDRRNVQISELTPREWRALRAVLFSQRLTGIAARAVEGGSLILTDEAAAELAHDYRDASVLCVILERKLLALAPAFEQAGIDVVVLKGPATARAFYPSPEWRMFGDVDLLVRTSDWRPACALLAELGFRRQLPEPRPGFDERFGKSATHVDGEGFQVDLHRTLALGALGLMSQPDELFDHTTSFLLQDTSLWRFDDTASLLHACVHASLGSLPPRLLPLRDVAQIARVGDVDWGSLAELARRWMMGAVVQHAFDTASRQLGVSLPSRAEPFLSWPTSRRERRLLAAYTTDRRRGGGLTLSMVRAVPGFVSKGAYLRALLFPDRAFLQARADVEHRATYRSRWRVPLRWPGYRSGGR
jgi:Uncharacterised nucleotidyltransferase